MKMESSTAVVVHDQVIATPAVLLNMAVQQGADLEKLEKLMALQERWEANNARKAYHEAMTAFKSNPPEIDKDKHVSFTTTKGVTSYHHATLWNVTDKISQELSKHGLSASWKTKQEANAITVTCRISHILGHYEETSLTASPDDSGGKNGIQAIGSTVTYLERYTILALTGLATSDMDNDGKGEVVYISDKEKSTIVDMLQSKEVPEEKFLAFMNCKSLETIPAVDFQKAMAALRSAKGKK